MQKSDFIPIVTSRLIIDEFKTSDYARLQEIAFNINHNADAVSYTHLTLPTKLEV